MGIKFGEIDTCQGFHMMLCQLPCKTDELLLTPDTAENKRQIIISQGTVVKRGCKYIQNMDHILFRFLNPSLRAGIFKTEHHGGKARQLVIQYFL